MKRSMPSWNPGSWNITARLILVATVPALVMLLVVAVSIYVRGAMEVEQMTRERGEQVAAALAQTSQFGVMSGNTADLDRNVQQLIKADRSIAFVTILDADHKLLVSAKGNGLRGTFVIERNIDAGVVPDVWSSDQIPSVSSAQSHGGLKQVGYVHVEMTSAPLLTEKRHNLYAMGGFVLAASALSGLIGLLLAQRLRAPLRAVMGALRQVRAGDYAVRFDPGRGEIAELQDSIVQMARALGRTRHELEDQVADRTRDLRDALHLAAEANEDRRQLIARTNTMLEDERKLIASEIHDELNGALIVVSLRSEQIAWLARNPSGDAMAEIASTAAGISQAVSPLYAAARNIVRRLRPEVIDTLGLTGAVAELVRHYSELQTGCAFSYEVSSDVPLLRGQLAIACYRVVQEALANVVKHSGATLAQVHMRAEDSSLLVQVRDNGKGFDVAKRRQDRMGLVGMRERVNSVGGSIHFESPSGGSTLVSIQLPLRDDDRSQ